MAVRLEVADVGAGQRLPQLEDQSRLADARVADERHDLPLAAQRQGQAALQQLELLAASQQLADATAEAQSRPFAAEQLLRGPVTDVAGAGAKLEAPGQQRGRLRRHEDAVDGRALDEL